MFSVHCPTHGTEVLLSERRIESIDAVEAGHRMRWRCWCGTVGTTFVPRATVDQMVGRHRPAV
jgi:phage terminase large subunit GpA-like protein